MTIETPAYDIDGMAWQLRRVYHFTTSDCTPGTCKGQDCIRMSHLDEAGFRAAAELAWRIADAQIAKMRRGRPGRRANLARR